MWRQIRAIAWAQLRIGRNHLPRTSFGAIAAAFLFGLWYAIFATIAAFIAWKLPMASPAELKQGLPVGLLCVFVFWQVVPLVTLSSGWALQLNKLQVYPIRTDALFTLETLLRLTSAPEMILVLVGVLIGLWRHSSVPVWAPPAVLLLIPASLFVQLAVRDLLLHTFQRGRFRELFAVLVIAIGVLPQLILRTGLGRMLRPHLFNVARSSLSPWYQVAALSTGRFSAAGIAILAAWTWLAYWLARRFFRRSLRADDRFQSTTRVKNATAHMLWEWWLKPAGLFPDPLGILIRKELQSLVRMPRFRVIFGMSCLFGLLFVLPTALRGNNPLAHFAGENLIPLLNLYGLLLLGESLLLNTFGFDRAAVQVYFVSPVSLNTVLRAKNVTALLLISIQTGAIVLAVSLAHGAVTLRNVFAGLLVTAVSTSFLLAIGNVLSLSGPKPVDPQQTLKKQSGAKMQIWALLSVLGMAILIGFAFLASFALQADWAFFGVLLGELLIGLLLYHFATEAAVAKGMRNSEKIVEILSKSGSPVELG